MLIVELWLSNVMQRLGPSRKRRDCRPTLSHDIINTFVHAGFSWHKLAQSLRRAKRRLIIKFAIDQHTCIVQPPVILSMPRSHALSHAV